MNKTYIFILSICLPWGADAGAVSKVIQSLTGTGRTTLGVVRRSNSIIPELVAGSAIRTPSTSRMKQTLLDSKLLREIAHRNLEFVELLEAGGAPREIDPRPLERIKSLLEAGANPNAIHPQNKLSALNMAQLFENNNEIVNVLREYGAEELMLNNVPMPVEFRIH